MNALGHAGTSDFPTPWPHAWGDWRENVARSGAGPACFVFLPSLVRLCTPARYESSSTAAGELFVLPPIDRNRYFQDFENRRRRRARARPINIAITFAASPVRGDPSARAYKDKWVPQYPEEMFIVRARRRGRFYFPVSFFSISFTSNGNTTTTATHRRYRVPFGTRRSHAKTINRNDLYTLEQFRTESITRRVSLFPPVQFTTGRGRGGARSVLRLFICYERRRFRAE